MVIFYSYVSLLEGTIIILQYHSSMPLVLKFRPPISKKSGHGSNFPGWGSVNRNKMEQTYVVILKLMLIMNGLNGHEWISFIELKPFAF